MVRKDKKKRLLGGTDIALAILAALGGSALFMTVVLVAGSIAFPDFWRRQTADAPSAQPSYRGTLPSKAPTATATPAIEESIAPDETDVPEPTQAPSEAVPDTSSPTQSQAPEQTNTPAPTRTQAPAPSRAPTTTRAPTPTRTPAAQNPSPIVSLNPTAPPVRQTQAPAQPGNQPTNSGSFANGQVLITTESNNNNDLVYHTTNCRSAQRIPAGSRYWYDSAQAAEAAGRRLCGNCAR